MSVSVVSDYNNGSAVSVVDDYNSTSGSKIKSFNYSCQLPNKAVGFYNEVIGSFTIPDDFDPDRNFTDCYQFIKFTHSLEYSPKNSGGLYAIRIYLRGEGEWKNEYAYYVDGSDYSKPIEGYSGVLTAWKLQPNQVYDIWLLIAYPEWNCDGGSVSIDFNYNTKN